MGQDEKNFLPKEEISRQIRDYKRFAFGKNMFAMALTLILANGMQKFVSTISQSILMPVINWMVSATGGNWRNLLFVPVPGLEIEIGNFASGFIEFTITTAFLYIIYVTIVKRIDPDSEISVK